MTVRDDTIPAAEPRIAARRTGLSRKARAIAATCVGNMLEWYDFTVYALLARYIAPNFFSDADPTTRLIQTYLVFGLGFVARPLGAIILGSYADRAGRKAALLLTILLMSIGTGVIAFAPTYSAVGLAAPLLLLLGRLLQGFSAGGEFGGAAAFLLENADTAQRGKIAAWVQASMGMSNILGALAAFSVTSLLSAHDLESWGWRLPFLFGLTILPVGLYLRRSLEETEAFNLLRARLGKGAGRTPAPLAQMLEKNTRQLLVGLAVAVLWAVAVYTLMIYLPTYIQRPDTFNFTAHQAFGASLIGNVPFVIGCVLFGAVSDRIGRRTSLFASSALLLVCVPPLFMWLEAHPTLPTLIVAQSIICILVSSFVGVAPAAVAETFPTGVRATGTALVYNGAFTIFGGFTPAILTWLTRPGGSVLAPAWYVASAALVAMAAIPALRPAGSLAEPP